jgi:hypothetical protein
MKSLDFGRCALGICAAAAMLAGCGGSQPPIGAPLVSNAAGAYSHHHTFRYTGAKQVFIVPGNVTEIHVVALGGNGGGCSSGSCYGGYGGRVSADIPVTPHQRLAVFVGGDATDGGFNGGGKGVVGGYGGGGASDVRSGGHALADRILVAGGGGGAGGNSDGSGDIGGGSGGGLTGGDGDGGSSGANGGGGGGGTQSTGGTGGHGGYGDMGEGAPGHDGHFGKGGAGGAGCARGSCYENGGGGGGGGGYYGGGGGGAGGTNTASDSGYGGGGGGGSSYAEPSATNVRFWQGWTATKDGLVVFRW